MNLMKNVHNNKTNYLALLTAAIHSSYRATHCDEIKRRQVLLLDWVQVVVVVDVYSVGMLRCHTHTPLNVILSLRRLATDTQSTSHRRHTKYIWPTLLNAVNIFTPLLQWTSSKRLSRAACPRQRIKSETWHGKTLKKKIISKRVTTFEMTQFV